MRDDVKLINEAYLKLVNENWHGQADPDHVRDQGPVQTDGVGVSVPQSEDDESAPCGWLTEYIGSFKRAFADVEGIGYGGDGVSDDQFAAAADQIIGSEWGDEAPKAKEALIYLLKGFYGIGIQDS